MGTKLLHALVPSWIDPLETECCAHVDLIMTSKYGKTTLNRNPQKSQDDQSGWKRNHEKILVVGQINIPTKAEFGHFWVVNSQGYRVN